MLSGGDTDVFVTDLQVSGVDFLTVVRERLPDPPIIVMTGYTGWRLVTHTRLGSIATTILAELSNRRMSW